MEPGDVTGGTEALAVPVCGPWEEMDAFEYTPELLAGPGTEEDPREVTIRGCECRDNSSCMPGTCTCLPHGANYANRTIIDNQRPILECNIMCQCGDACPNRETQTGLQFRLKVLKLPGKGWGLLAEEDIPKGRFVCEYAGEVLGFEEASRRIHSQKPSDNNYIIAVREHLHGGRMLQTFVDPTRKGNVGRFLNHSCQPNLFMVPVRTHSMVPKLALFAGRSILAGEELCYDYSGISFNPVPGEETPKPGTENIIPRFCKRCLCGTASCSGYLPYDDSLYKAGTD